MNKITKRCVLAALTGILCIKYSPYIDQVYAQEKLEAEAISESYEWESNTNNMGISDAEDLKIKETLKDIVEDYDRGDIAKQVERYKVLGIDEVDSINVTWIDTECLKGKEDLTVEDLKNVVDESIEKMHRVNLGSGCIDDYKVVQNYRDEGLPILEYEGKLEEVNNEVYNAFMENGEYLTAEEVLYVMESIESKENK